MKAFITLLLICLSVITYGQQDSIEVLALGHKYKNKVKYYKPSKRLVIGYKDYANNKVSKIRGKYQFNSDSTVLIDGKTLHVNDIAYIKGFNASMIVGGVGSAVCTAGLVSGVSMINRGGEGYLGEIAVVLSGLIVSGVSIAGVGVSAAYMAVCTKKRWIQNGKYNLSIQNKIVCYL